MKKNLLLIFILIFTLTFMGCGAKEKIAEQVIEGATGVEVDINDAITNPNNILFLIF